MTCISDNGRSNGMEILTLARTKSARTVHRLNAFLCAAKEIRVIMKGVKECDRPYYRKAVLFLCQNLDGNTSIPPTSSLERLAQETFQVQLKNDALSLYVSNADATLRRGYLLFAAGVLRNAGYTHVARVLEDRLALTPEATGVYHGLPLAKKSPIIRSSKTGKC